MKKHNLKKAFTVVELVIVIAVIAILSSVLIPTFTEVIKKSNVSADTQNVASLNTQLAIYDFSINNEKDLEAAIDSFYGNGYSKSISPQSANYGYHFWYDYYNNKIVLDTYKNLSSIDMVQAEPVANSFSQSPRSSLVNGYYLLDKTGSKITQNLLALENLSSSNYRQVFNDIKNGDEINKKLFSSLKSIAIANDNGIFVVGDEQSTVTKLFVANETTVIGANKYSLSEKPFSLSDVKTVNLPENVKVSSYALDTLTLVNDDWNCSGSSEIYVNATQEDLFEIFDARSINGVIVLPNGARYVMHKNTFLLLSNGSQTAIEGNVPYTNPVVNFDFAVNQQLIDNQKANLIKQQNGQYELYLAYDQKDFSLSCYNFVDVNGNSVPSESIEWYIEKGEQFVQKIGDGQFEIIDLHPVSNAPVITVCAKEFTGGAIKKINVYSVRINSLTIQDVNGTQPSVNSFTLYYEGPLTTQWQVNVKTAQNPSFDACGVICDDQFQVSFENNSLFTYEDGVLTLKDKVKYGFDTIILSHGNLTTSYSLTLQDVSASPFTVSNNADTSKYNFNFVVGNQNAIKLSSLFTLREGESIDANASVNIKCFDLEFNDSPEISASEFTYTPASDWQNSTVKFNGFTGTAKIQIDAGGKSCPVTVNVVNAKNVTLASEWASTNMALLNDITVQGSSISTVSLSNGVIYGNYHKITAKGFVNTNGADFITLSNSSVEKLLLDGPVYPKVVLSGDKATGYFVSGIHTTGTCTISDSYIFGFRQPVRISSGGLTINRSILEGGVYANLYLYKADTVTFNDSCTVQNKEGYKATVGDNLNLNVIGLGIFVDTSESDGCNIIFTGNSHQYNWISENDKSKYNVNQIDEYSGSISVDNYEHQNGYFNCGIVEEKGFSFSPKFATQVQVNNYTGPAYTKVDKKILVKNFRIFYYSNSDCSNCDHSFLPSNYGFDNFTLGKTA